MYCIECGAQIPNNSKFCSHCGKPQNEAEPSIKEKVAEKIIENEIVRQVVEEHKRSLDYQFLKKSYGLVFSLGCFTSLYIVDFFS